MHPSVKPTWPLARIPLREATVEKSADTVPMPISARKHACVGKACFVAYRRFCVWKVGLATGVLTAKEWLETRWCGTGASQSWQFFGSAGSGECYAASEVGQGTSELGWRVSSRCTAGRKVGRTQRGC